MPFDGRPCYGRVIMIFLYILELFAHTTSLIVLLLFVFIESRINSDTPCSPKAVCARQCAYCHTN